MPLTGRQRAGLIAAVALGLASGLGLFTFGYARGASYPRAIERRLRGVEAATDEDTRQLLGEVVTLVAGATDPSDDEDPVG